MVVTEGPVDPRSRLFVGRTGELKTLQSWVASTDCVGAVMGARQTGKTSLLLKLRHALQRKYAFVFVDLQAVEGADVPDCFRYIAAEISGQLGAKRSPAAALPGNGHEFLGFLRELSEDTTAVRSILILDELGALPPETAMKLASAIRALFTNRLIRPAYAKYVVLLAGATDMLELTTGRNSPLRNVTESVYLGDLSLAETEQLMMHVLGRARVRSTPEIVRYLHDWTGGHPYWTQLLAGALRSPSGDLSETRLAGIVATLLPTEDKNLPHVFKLLKDDRTLWNLVELVLSGGSIKFSRANPPVARLELIGLVKNRDGQCAIRNRIYQEALTQQQTSPRQLTPADLRRLAQRLGEAADPHALMHLAADELRGLLQSRSVALFQISPDRLSYRLSGSAGLSSVAAQTSFATARGLSTLLTATFDPEVVALDEDERRLLRDLHCAAVVPLRHKNRTVGFVSLGRKLSDRPYEQHELDFVAAVSEQVVACQERFQLREIEQDAERARAIQEQLLPKTIPQVPGVEIAAHWRPARSVGGDYYDVLRVADRTIAFCIGDVVGKGIAAALMMSNLQAAVRSRAAETLAPRLMCHELNQLIARNVATGKYITFFYGLLDGETRRLTYSNAGHNPPVLLRSNGDVQRLRTGGGVLGVVPEWQYGEDAVDLNPGDRLLLFTDGASEVWNRDGDELGEEGLIKLFNGSRGVTAEAMQTDIMNDISAFAGGQFADDVTMLVITLPVTRG